MSKDLTGKVEKMREILERNKQYWAHSKHPFDYERFYLWAERQKIPIYISEYQMPKDRFVCVAEKEKRCKISATTSKIIIERIFRPRTQL